MRQRDGSAASARSSASTCSAARSTSATIATTAARSTTATGPATTSRAATASSASATASSASATSTTARPRSKSARSAAGACAAAYSDSAAGTAIRATRERKQNAFLCLQTPSDGDDRNIPFTQSAWKTEVDLIYSGARRSHEGRNDVNFIDVETDLSGHGRRASKRLSRRNRWRRRPESKTEKFDVVSRPGWYGSITQRCVRRAQNVVRPAAISARSIAAHDDSGNIIASGSAIQRERRCVRPQRHAGCRASCRGLHHNRNHARHYVVRRLQINLPRTNVNKVSGLSIDLDTRSPERGREIAAPRRNSFCQIRAED